MCFNISNTYCEKATKISKKSSHFVSTLLSSFFKKWEIFFKFCGLFTISEVYDCNHSTAKKIITIMMMITISNIQTTFTELCIESE